MAGKGGIYRLMIIVITALAATGCSSPVGNIGGGLASSKAYDGLQVAYQLTYKVGESFKRSDLQLSTIKNGQSKVVPTSDYEVYIIENPGPSEVLSPPVQSSYEFKDEGRKIILVRYDGLQIRCPTDVLPSGSEGNQASGIKIEWVP